ncbi:hypothetical protein [Methylobacterium nigriterrae]|uniref:hypothetical protein n=1 Tax=Methylobacterium nigriterrae TaxID=3127512 RepID=UPI0030137845
MDYDRLTETEHSFASADRLWRAEVMRRFGPDGVLLHGYLPEGRGEPGTVMRRAFETRQRAILAWRQARHS